MSFAARLYTLSKKKNSTKQPDVAYTETMITLKEGTIQLDPIIKLDLGMTSVPHWNYMYIPSFNRYYFLSGAGWTWSERCWYGQFTVDPLASWKSQIGASRCYVLRSSADYNGDIKDLLYPALTSTQNIRTFEAVPNLTNVLQNGSFIVGILSGNTGANYGSVTYYAFDRSTFATFIDALMGDNQFQAADITNDLYKAFFNPFQYVVSCTWLPVPLAQLPISQLQPVKLGWWTIQDANGVIATAPMISQDSRFNTSGSLDCAAHPQAIYRGNYMNTEPFRSVQFQLMPFGAFNLNNVPNDATSIGYEIELDCITGLATLYITAPGAVDSYYLATVQAQLGVQIALSQKANGVIEGISGVISGAITGASGVASGNPIMSIAGGLSAIESALEAFRYSVQTIGASNGVATTGIVAELNTVYRLAVDDDNADRGRPLCEVRTLSTLSGYIMCADAEPAIPCSADELSAIISYLNGGFFYE